MLRVHYTIMKEERFGKARPMTKGGSLFEYPSFQYFSPSYFCLHCTWHFLPRGEALVNFRRIAQAIPRALSDLDLSRLLSCRRRHLGLQLLPLAHDYFRWW